MCVCAVKVAYRLTYIYKLYLNTACMQIFNERDGVGVEYPLTPTILSSKTLNVDIANEKELRLRF